MLEQLTKYGRRALQISHTIDYCIMNYLTFSKKNAILCEIDLQSIAVVMMKPKLTLADIAKQQLTI